MLGSGINPESFKQDYSGFARAAATQAQGMSDLGASIGGVIKDFGEAKKEQKKVDAYNKASVKAIEAAITLGGSYGITGAEDTLRPFLEAYNDPNLSPIEKAALLDEGKGMIPNVFGRFDASQADAIQRAQINARNAPPMPESFKQEDKLLSVAGGNILVKQGNDGQTYDSSGQYPIYDLAAFISGAPPEVYSDPNRANIDPVTGIDPQSISNAAENQYFQGKGPLLENQIDSALYADEGILPAIGQIPDPSIPSPPNTNQGGFIAPSVPQAGTSRLIAEPSKAEAKESYRPFTPEEITRYGSDGQVSSTGRVYPIRPPSGTEFTTNPDGSVTYRTGSGFGDKDKKAVDSKIDKAMSLTQDLNLLEDRTKSMASGVVGAVGRMAAEQIPGTFQAENKEVIDRVIATLTLENLQAMRNNSPTGASLGNISDKDTGLMRDSATSLKNAQSPESFKKELVRLKNLQHDVIYGSKRVLEQKLNKGEITKAQFDEAMANAPTEYLDERGAIRTKKVKGNIDTLSSESQDIYKEFGIE